MIIAVIIITTILIAVYLWNIVEIRKYNKETTKKIENEIFELRDKVIDVKALAENAHSIASETDVQIDQLREYVLWRQYLIDTNFCGKLKNKKLLQEFVDCFPTTGLSGDTHTKAFQRFKEATLECENIHRATTKPYNDVFFDVIKKLEELEKKQEILDTYKPEKVEKTEQKVGSKDVKSKANK